MVAPCAKHRLVLVRDKQALSVYQELGSHFRCISLSVLMVAPCPKHRLVLVIDKQALSVYQELGSHILRSSSVLVDSNPLSQAQASAS